jgi:hypothetical protein
MLVMNLRFEFLAAIITFCLKEGPLCLNALVERKACMDNLATMGMKTSQLRVLSSREILGELIFFYSEHTFFSRGVSLLQIYYYYKTE